MDQQSVAQRLQLAHHAQQRLRGRPLQKRARLRVQRHTKKVVVVGIADIQMNGWIQRNKFHEIGLAELARLFGRFRGKGRGSEFFQRFRWGDVVEVRGIGSGIGAIVVHSLQRENDAGTRAVSMGFHFLSNVDSR